MALVDDYPAGPELMQTRWAMYVSNIAGKNLRLVVVIRVDHQNLTSDT